MTHRFGDVMFFSRDLYGDAEMSCVSVLHAQGLVDVHNTNSIQEKGNFWGVLQNFTEPLSQNFYHWVPQLEPF